MTFSPCIANAQQPSNVGREIPPDFRGKIVYKGYMEGTAKVPMGGNQSGINGLLNNMLNVRTVPLSGGVEQEVQYYGNRFQGVMDVNSQVPGLSGRSTFSGVRNGTVCEWVSEDGGRGVSNCSFELFHTVDNYTNPNGQKISTVVSTTMMSIVDLGAQERKQAADQAEKAAAEAEKKARENKLDEALERALKPK
jgi:hypothetical protein